MSDQIDQGLPGTDTGQYQPGSTQEPAPQSQPTYVTETIFDERLKQLETNIAKLVQSQTDRSLSGLKKEVQRRLSEFEEIAQEAGVPAQIVEAERARLWQEALADYRERTTQPATPMPNAKQIEAVQDWIGAISDELRVGILRKGDPEWAEVDFTNPNPETFKASYDTAIRKKAARLGNVSPGQQPPAGNPARVPTAGVGGQGGSDLMAQYLREVQTVRPGSEEVMQIRRKYRQKGLDI